MLNVLHMLPLLCFSSALEINDVKVRNQPPTSPEAGEDIVPLELQQLQSFYLSIWKATNRYNTPNKPVHQNREVMSQKENGEDERRD